MCTICQQIINNDDIIRILTYCKHLFHLQCVDMWLSNHNTCPSCRHNVNELITPSITPSNDSNTPIPQRPPRIPYIPTQSQEPEPQSTTQQPESQPHRTEQHPTPQQPEQPEPTPQIHVFTGSFEGINDLRNDINNLVSTSIPIINTMFSSNTEPILNTSNIQNNVNSLFNSINSNQMFQLFNNLTQTRRT